MAGERGVRGSLLLAAVLALALVGGACAGLPTDIDPLELRARALEKGIMCPICPAESIDQSQVELAKQMRVMVKEKLTEGWTDQEIKDFFVERYGPRVLMEPPQEGFNLLAWVLPPVGVLVGVVTLVLVLRHWLGSGPVNEPDALEGLSEEEREEYLRRVERVLQDDLGLEAVEGERGWGRGESETPGGGNRG